ncbi:MAG TPA: hypothetical protein VKY37_09525 [Brumimicrobium sp.]|nr:hypothetical protein [Brumimicrobium sp.]
MSIVTITSWSLDQTQTTTKKASTIMLRLSLFYDVSIRFDQLFATDNGSILIVGD